MHTESSSGYFCTDPEIEMVLFLECNIMQEQGDSSSVVCKFVHLHHVLLRYIRALNQNGAPFGFAVLVVLNEELCTHLE